MKLANASVDVGVVIELLVEVRDCTYEKEDVDKLTSAIFLLERLQTDYFKPLYASRPKHPPTVPKAPHFAGVKCEIAMARQEVTPPVRKATLVGLAAPSYTSRPLGMVE